MPNICLLSPNLDESRFVDAKRILPPDVNLTGVGYRVARYTDDEFGRVESAILSAAETVADTDCQLLVVTGELFQAHLGHEKSAALTAEIARIARCDAIAIASSIAEALGRVGAKRIAVASPFTADQTDVLTRFLEKEALSIAGTSSHGCRTSDEVWRLDPETAYEAGARLLGEHPAADALYLPNNQWRVTSVIERLEDDFGKPVVANTPAWIKSALRRVGADRPIPGFGSLLGG